MTQQIPKELQAIGGMQWDEARVTGDVLKAFGLTCELRQAFISYKRTDSEGIAMQLAYILFVRGYQIFLDTASVERGLPLQDVLHDRLANTDLVVLLDSPHALDSVWVHEELDLVNHLGLGVLQLLWTELDPSDPGVRKLKATRGTEFSVRFPLEESYFEDSKVMLGPKTRLRPETLTAIADQRENRGHPLVLPLTSRRGSLARHQRAGRESRNLRQVGGHVRRDVRLLGRLRGVRPSS